ncbi:MAG TPA: rhomboid family intramembrane serine protease [Longimicrobium sp.]|nr:rhomboid family intramembrane serine protease [Longimicrobium sp.]
MPYYSSSSFDSPFRTTVTRWVRWLLIANTAVFGVMLVLELARIPAALIYDWIALRPRQVLLRPWTVLTYAFVHAGVFHWFFNMVALYFFGPRLEERWGSREFVKFYLIAAAGGALFSFISPGGTILGASAAINGLLMAWAVYWPDDEILLLGVFPVKIKWLVIAMGFFSMFSAMGVQSDGVAHLAHLGGFLTALAYLKSPWAPAGWGDLPAKPRSSKKKPSKALVPWPGKKEEASARPAAPAGVAPTSARRSAGSERELLDDVDRILDKISAQGLASLTPEERARLDEVSRRYRTN